MEVGHLKNVMDLEYREARIRQSIESRQTAALEGSLRRFASGVDPNRLICEHSQIAQHIGNLALNDQSHVSNGQ